MCILHASPGVQRRLQGRGVLRGPGAWARSRVPPRARPSKRLACADQDRLARELDAEAVAHRVLDGARKIEELGRGGGAAVDEGERVLAGDTDVAAGVTFFEACVLDEPRRR